MSRMEHYTIHPYALWGYIALTLGIAFYWFYKYQQANDQKRVACRIIMSALTESLEKNPEKASEIVPLIKMFTEEMN